MREDEFNFFNKRGGRIFLYLASTASSEAGKFSLHYENKTESFTVKTPEKGVGEPFIRTIFLSQMPFRAKFHGPFFLVLSLRSRAKIILPP